MEVVWPIDIGSIVLVVTAAGAALVLAVAGPVIGFAFIKALEYRLRRSTFDPVGGKVSQLTQDEYDEANLRHDEADRVWGIADEFFHSGFENLNYKAFREFRTNRDEGVGEREIVQDWQKVRRLRSHFDEEMS